MIPYTQLVSTMNTLFKEVDNVQNAFPEGTRPHDRLNTIRDQLVLLAMDLQMPIRPVQQPKDDDQAGNKP